MAKTTKRFIAANAVDETKILLSNNAALKARNADDSADINILKVNASDAIEFSSFPITPSSAPNADYKVANKKYVDDEIDAHIVGAVLYKGAFDASAGDYTAITNPQAGWFYKVSVGGVIGARTYVAGDNMYINKNVVGNPVIGDIDVIDNTEIVSSVNSKVGAVVLVTDDIAEDGEPVNLWFTAARAKAAAVADSITDAVTDVAPSQNAVFDALANKVATSRTVNGHALTADVTVTKSDVSLGNVDNVQQLPISYLDTDNTLAADSDAKVASQKAVKAFVAAQIGAIPSAAAPRSEILTLDATDISNGYKDLALLALSNASVAVTPVGGPMQEQGVDYTLSAVSSKTRITFAGDLAALLIATDKLMVQYHS